MLRRDWLKNVATWGIGTVGLPLVDALARSEDAWASSPVRPGQWSVVQGATSESAVQFSILVQKNQVPHVRLVDAKTGWVSHPHYREVASRDDSQWALLKVRFAHLKARSFHLEITHASATDRRQVELPQAGCDRAKIAVISCIQDTRFKHQQVAYWRNFASLKPDALFLIGDHVYVDGGQSIAGESWEQRIWRRYAEARLHHELYYLPKLIPILSTWDDHDYGLNNADGFQPWKEKAKKIFCEFFAQDPDDFFTNFEAGPGVATRMDWMGTRYILTDDRYWRNMPSRSGKTHWGDEQEDWIDAQIDGAPGTVFLMNGSQYFGAYFPGESYEGNHQESFRAFLSRLKGRKNKVIFVSGDRHFTEVMRISKKEVGYETIEITSSGFIQIYPLKPVWHLFRNKRRIVGAGEARNFAMLDVRASESGRVAGNVTAYTSELRRLFSRAFDI